MTKDILKLIEEDDNFKNSLDIIIDNLKNMSSKDLEQMILKLINDIILTINNEYDLGENKLVIDQKLMRQIAREFKKILLSMGRYSKDEIAKLIIDQFIKTIDKSTEGKIVFKLNQKDKKRLEEEILRMIIYEEYKAINPNRIAGEKSAENFISNAIIRGVKEALKYEGGSKKHSEGMLKELDKYHKEHKKGFSK